MQILVIVIESTSIFKHIYKCKITVTLSQHIFVKRKAIKDPTIGVINTDWSSMQNGFTFFIISKLQKSNSIHVEHFVVFLFCLWLKFYLFVKFLFKTIHAYFQYMFKTWMHFQYTKHSHNIDIFNKTGKGSVLWHNWQFGQTLHIQPLVPY